MSQTFELMVLMTNISDHCKHWGLLIDDINNPQAGDNFLQVSGPPGNQQYKSERIEFGKVPHLSDYVRIGEVKENDFDTIRTIAREKVPIRNDIPNWNSQDYVIALLDHLKAREYVIDSHNSYMRQKRVVKRMKEVEDSAIW